MHRFVAPSLRQCSQRRGGRDIAQEDGARTDKRQTHEERSFVRVQFVKNNSAQTMESAWEVLSGGEEPSLSEVERIVDALQAADDVRIQELFDSGKIGVLFERLEDVEQRHRVRVYDEDEESQVRDLQLQSAYLRAVKGVMGKVSGLQRMCTSSELVGRVALSLDSADVSICTQVLELLAVLAVGSEEGFESVRHSVDYFRLAKKERVRFESLVEALRSECTPTPFKRDVMLFVNTLVNSAPDVDQRVEIRGELVRAGVLEAIAKLKDRTLALSSSVDGFSTDTYELEIQLQVFETVLENDHKTTLASLDDDATQESSVKLDDVDSLFKAVKTHAATHHCDQQLLGVLQYLVAIPSYDVLGKEHWVQVLRAAHRAVLGVDDDFDASFDEIKTVLSWKKSLEDRDSTIDSLRNELKNRQKELDKLRSDETLKTLKESLKAKDDTIDDLNKTLADIRLKGNSQPTLMEDPKYGKFFKMLQMHVPREAVENKMRAEGIDVAVLDLDPGKPLIDSSSGPPPDPKYAKFFKMLQMHVPREAVENKMRCEGLDPSVLDNPPGATTSSSADGSAEKRNILADDPKYGKYIKMMKMHLPRGAVESKMRLEGADPKVLDLDPSKPMPADFFGPPLKDDPKFGKYFKMLKMHLPRVAVEGKMTTDSLEAFHGVLDCDPEKPLPEKFKGGDASKKTTLKKKEPSQPKKPNPKPRVAMRSLFWSKIDEHLRDKTVWKNLSDDTIDLDLESLESDFAKVKKKTADEEAAEKEKEDARKKEKEVEKPKDVGLVDGKVQQNVGIALKKIKMSNADLFEAIVKVDEGKLDVVRMELLLKSCPTPEDASLVNDWVSSDANDPKSLGQVEAFFHTIAPIPELTHRLECMVFKQKLEQTCELLDDRLKTITAACEQVSRSERLAKLLEVVLKIGNYINGGTTRGGVVGYKLDALAKLATVKSLDNQKNLMNWLCQWCEKRDASLLEVAGDFPDIEEAARCSLAQWQEDFRQLEKKIALVQQHVAARRKSCPQKNDRFVEVMSPFKEQAVSEVETLRHRFQATEQRFGVLVSSFGEDPKTCGVEKFFKDLLGDFVGSFHKAHSQNQKRRAMEEKAAQKKIAEEKKAALKAQSGELVTNIFQDLGNEAANDILAKLQGPRQRRAQGRRAGPPMDSLQKESAQLPASPNSDRMQKFIKRLHGADSGTAAYEKLAAFRDPNSKTNKTTTSPKALASSPATKAPAPSERASKAAAKLEAFRRRIEPQAADNALPVARPGGLRNNVPEEPGVVPTPPSSNNDEEPRQPPKLRDPPKRASIENQPDLQTLAGGDQGDVGGGGELLRRLQAKKERNRRRMSPGSS